jgi:alkanesulfonate monooxygenase
MPLHLYWFLPSHGDGREIGKPANGAAATARGARREPDIGYLAQVARAADELGFTGALTPAGLFCEDPWLVAAALSGQTKQLRFMVAFRPGIISPTLAAQMAATCQRLSGGRLLLNVVVGGDADEQHRYGDWLEHDERYARADEFLTIVRGAWTGRPFDFTGEHYRVAGGMVTRRPAHPPTVFVGGASAAAQRVAARHADVYLTWGEPPGPMAEQLARARALAEAERRDLALGSRFQVIARDTEAEAWAEAERLLAGMSPDAVVAAQRRFRRSESEGQRRMAALHGGRTERLEVYPNLWAGYGLLRPGPAMALVGSHEQVAERIEEFHGLGLDHLILSGQPHLEEAYWFGEGVMPLLRRRGLLPVPDAAGRSPAAGMQAAS